MSGCSCVPLVWESLKCDNRQLHSCRLTLSSTAPGPSGGASLFHPPGHTGLSCPTCSCRKIGLPTWESRSLRWSDGWPSGWWPEGGSGLEGPVQWD